MDLLQQVDPFRNLSSGLQQLQEHCDQVYPEHPKPIPCLKPNKSFILEGGSDPLDYIYVYKNQGQPNQSVPKHWHYIGMGLSDIHGYTLFCTYTAALRQVNPNYANSVVEIYPPPNSIKKMSGFGFELTMRVRCNSEDEWQQDPPTWPAKILQDLARYVFQSRNIFHDGDHVAWHAPLDSIENGAESSRVEHVLMTIDPQLAEIDTHLGSVKFIQIVGVCNEELEAARQWNVRGILGIMREREETGGEFLVTDMRRGFTIFDLNPHNYKRLEDEIERVGSDMAQISAKHKTSYLLPVWYTEAEMARNDPSGIGEDHEDCGDRNNSVRRFLKPSGEEQLGEDDGDQPARPSSRMSVGSQSSLLLDNVDLTNVRYYNSIYLLLGFETSRVLPVMLNGRLAHKRPFSFQSFKGDSLVTFVPEGSIMKSLVEAERPIARQGSWLQIYVPDELCQRMYETILPDFRSDRPQGDASIDEVNGNDDGAQLRLPRNYSWPEFNLHLTIVNEILDDD